MGIDASVGGDSHTELFAVSQLSTVGPGRHSKLRLGSKAPLTPCPHSTQAKAAASASTVVFTTIAWQPSPAAYRCFDRDRLDILKPVGESCYV